jgi:hypothetical protein
MRKKLLSLAGVVVISSLLLACSESPKSPPPQAKPAASQGQQPDATKCEFQLVKDDTGAEMLQGPGKKIYKKNSGVNGPLELFDLQGDFVLLSGWGCDRDAGVPPVGFALFVDGSCRALVSPVERPDVAAHFKNPRLNMTGFTFRVPKSVFEGRSPEDLRIFIVTEDSGVGEVYTRIAKEGSAKVLWKKSGPK